MLDPAGAKPFSKTQSIKFLKILQEILFCIGATLLGKHNFCRCGWNKMEPPTKVSSLLNFCWINKKCLQIFCQVFRSVQGILN